MEDYKPRLIKFKELYKTGDWFIKIYIITKDDLNSNTKFYRNVKEKLPKWLELKNDFNSKHDHVGFLIIHEGTEGIFSLINWWVGGNMLNTHIFKTNYDNLKEFEKISGNGLAPCVWELEIINRERLAWTNLILKQNLQPNFKTYLNTTFQMRL
ncbi:hypothetical protein [Winogradskyella sp. PE311]|uniref:hypothetical protein n=1 Tax=Winogradskyella sp. PE311 TaxID=3366943 RepID=UPI00397F5FEA